ncbi:MAG TPA: DUF1735 domain-containing protein [Phnomibacter sp.]|nr:DUF1735 domain-containing protein [Phnomibacter sp.]
MRKNIFNISHLSMLALSAVLLTGCLKDAGFDDGTHGSITSNTEGGTFISIPKANNRPNTMGLESKTGMQSVDLFQFSYDNVNPAPAGVSATVAVNNALVTDPAVTILPTTAYTLPALTTAFTAGEYVSDMFKFNINTSLLDPMKKYGIGFTLTGVVGGAKIPANLKDVVFVFTIKNKYDGIYNIRCHMLAAADRDPNWVRTPFDYAYQIHLVTTGPKTVKWINTAFAGNVGYHPLMTPAVSGFGQTEPTFEFDASDNLIAVTNTFTPVTNGRSFLINSGVTGSKYTSAKKIYAAFIMKQTGFLDMPIYDSLTFSKARP